MITVRHNSIRPFPWLILIVTVSFALVPWWTDNVSLRENLILAALDITLASNLNLMLGYAGYVNFGNIVMFGLGGYFGVYLVSVWHWPILVATLVGGIAVSAIAYVFGLGILRLRGAYFALATIGVNETVSVFVTNFDPWGGASGLYLSLDAYTPLGGPGRALWIVYFLMVAVMGLSLALSYAIRRSKFGLGLLAIGENEDAAAILGVPTRIYKAMVYSVSAFLPAVAGSLYFFKSGIIEPTGAFDLTTSIETIVMVMLGGQGTVAGPVIGAFLYEELRGYLLTAEAFSHFQLVIAGLLLLLIVLFAPSGLMGFVHLKLPFTRRWLE
jgi:branched-chain amino acid transport system permease protein